MRNLYRALILLAGMCPLRAQNAQSDTSNFEGVYDSGDSKIKSNWAFNIQISTDGFVLGGVYNHKLAKNTFLATSLDMFWVRGKDEQLGINPITLQPETINSETILLLPLQVSMKRRIFAESVSNTLRPYISVGVGAVCGIFISSDSPDSILPAPQDHFQFGPTATLGFGADFGKPGASGYGMDIRYQILRFKNHIGARNKFDNFQIGFHMNFR